MSLTRLLAVAKKELLHIVRDARSLSIVIVMPVALMLLFGYGVNLDLKRIPIYVYDQDGSQQSQDLLKRFQASEYFRIICVANSSKEIARALDSGDARMGFVIPRDFSRRISRGGPVNVQAVVDATDNNTANVLMGYTQAVVQGYSTEVQLDWLQAHGQIHPARSAEHTNPHLVQRGYREQRLHSSRCSRARHVGHRCIPDLANHRA